MRRALLVLLAACGDNAATPPDAPAAIDAPAGVCDATFAGNFSETSSSLANCASVSADGVLAFTVPSQTLGTSLAISIELGNVPTVGNYSSQSARTWHASATQTVNGRNCHYTAGSDAVPHGSFALTIDAFAPATAHGTLAVLTYVLAEQSASCGTGDNETVMLRF